MEPSEEFVSWLEELMALSESSEDIQESISRARRIAATVAASSHPEKAKAALLFSASSVILNCAFELEDVAAIDHGRELAKQALGATTPDEPLHFQCRYNIANATNTLCEPELPEAVDGATLYVWEPLLILSRLMTRTEPQIETREDI